MTRTPTDDAWPTSERDTIVSSRDTLVDAPPPPPVGPPPDRRIGWGMLFGIGVLALVALGILIAWLVTHRDSGHQTTTVVVTSNAAPTTTAAAVGKVAVPRVVGLKEPQALTRLAQVGLRPKEVYRPTKQPKGVVVSQKPKEATSLQKGSQVTIVIDSGAPKVAVPDARGATVADAQKKLDALGLDSTTTQVTSAKPAGTVVDEAPAPGTKLAKGSTVTLSVAKAAPVAVPNVTGQQASDAQSALQGAGFAVHTVTVHSQLPKGQVTAQNPPAGQKAAHGSSVRINVSDGAKGSGASPAPTTTAAATTTQAQTQATTTSAAPPQPASASVPSLTGDDLQAAVQKLNGAGFLASIQYIPGTDPLGTILQQAPAAGKSAPARSHVTINASSGPGNKPQETVPDLSGKSLQDAVAAANAAHLRLIYVKLPVQQRSQAGEIVAQAPDAVKQAPQNAQILAYLGAYQQGG